MSMDQHWGKNEILAWRKRALERVAARRKAALPGWEGLSTADADAYERSIENYFQRLRAAHNQRVAERLAREAGKK